MNIDFEKHLHEDAVIEVFGRVNDTAALARQLSMTFERSKYKDQLKTLYSYYLWMKRNPKSKIFPSHVMKHFTNMPLKYVFYYLMYMAFPRYLEKKGTVTWWTESYHDLRYLKKLDGHRSEKIVKSWVEKIGNNVESASKKSVLLRDIYGSKLLRYLSETFS